MNLSTALAEIILLSVDERLRLVEAIWDSIAAEPDQLDLTGGRRQEVERRLAAHAAAPEKVISWEEVKAQALARARG